jgi:glucose-6-phosphate isomerase
MRDLFAQDPKRATAFSHRWNDLFLDYSKNRITPETLKLLRQLLQEAKVEELRDRMFHGDKINLTENRSVLHIALRRPANQPLIVEGKDLMPEVEATRQHMKSFSDQVRSGEWRGYTGQPISDVVNIGIGGSDLGPVMVTEALKPFSRRDLKMHFVSNIDSTQLVEVLRICKPSSTLFLVASKTFTTQETLTNAETARTWVLSHYGGNQGSPPSISQPFLYCPLHMPPQPPSPSTSLPSAPPPKKSQNLELMSTTCLSSGTGLAAATLSGQPLG